MCSKFFVILRWMGAEPLEESGIWGPCDVRIFADLYPILKLNTLNDFLTFIET